MDDKINSPIQNLDRLLEYTPLTDEEYSAYLLQSVSVKDLVNATLVDAPVEVFIPVDSQIPDGLFS